MTDKDFLKRIEIAYKVYPNQHSSIEEFINWMYKQYGIVKSENNKH